MKTYGAVRKLMFILVLSILGSYCIGVDQQSHVKVAESYDVMKSTYGLVFSVGTYCYKLWSEILSKVMSAFDNNHNESVKIQMVEENMHGNNDSCTDGKEDCIYNEEFFNDSWITGKVDEDPTTHLDIDGDPIVLVRS